MKFIAKSKLVKADLTKKSITLQFTVDLTNEDMLFTQEKSK